MKKIILLAFLFITAISNSQEITWAKKNKIVFSSKGILTDNTGNVIHYGGKFVFPGGYQPGTLSDTTGSFLGKYSSSGNLLLYKRWKIPFYIQKVIYDNNSSMYVAGIFAGSQTIDGISISSEGEFDGFIGKMDLNGNFQWISTLGGKLGDGANALCFDSLKTNVVVTGSVHDSLSINHVYKSKSKRALLLASFNLSGALVSYKMYDFVAGKSDENMGREICNENKGNLYALVAREGKHWNGDTLNAPDEGNYIMKFNKNFDTIWTKFIIGPGCYYGFNCNSLKAAHNGDAYISQFCSSKYGGSGYFQRHNGNNGNSSWNKANTDGSYADAYLDSNTVFLIGREDANGCPCQDNNPGYQVIRKIDENNNDIGETRIKDVNLTDITKDKTGNIYVTGHFYHRKVVIGKDTIWADSTAFGSTYSYFGSFIIKLNDKTCTPPEINMKKNYPFTTYFCPTDSVKLDVGSGYSAYLWSNGATTQQIKTNTPGQYGVKVTQSSGCVAYSLPIDLLSKQNTDILPICMASYDTISKKNKIVWTMNFNQGTDYYRIYKETGPNTYAFIDTVYYSSYKLQLIDKGSKPDSVSEKYVVTTVDTCGNESPKSAGHRSILLTVNHSGGNNILSWQHYDGFTYPKYYIYRGTTTKNLVLIDSVASTAISYTDVNVSPSMYYQLRVKKTFPCYTGGSTPLAYSMSNIRTSIGLTTSMNIASISGTLKVYPNPTENVINIHYRGDAKKAEWNIRNVLGQIIYSKTSEVNRELNDAVDLSKQAKGIYFVEISADGQKEVRKIVLE